MSSDCFQFKQFCVRHDRCSMKVGTDGVLLGAWAGQLSMDKVQWSMVNGQWTMVNGQWSMVNGQRLMVNGQWSTILDIGTGSGLIALMLAQRFPHAKITGIDIDLPSVEQARENVALSPFRNIGILHHPLESFNDGRYQLIVSNPPFYEEDTQSKTEQLHNAKHTASLTFDQLIEGVDRLLDSDGEFDVILPYAAAEHFIGLAAIHGLYLARRCDVKGSPTRPAKRTMMAFCRTSCTTDHTLLIIRTPQNTYSEEYRRLTQAFYL